MLVIDVIILLEAKGMETCVIIPCIMFSNVHACVKEKLFAGHLLKMAKWILFKLLQ